VSVTFNAFRTSAEGGCHWVDESTSGSAAVGSNLGFFLDRVTI
jgi:hypothetical protein